MDLTDPDTWINGAKVVIAAPQIVVPLLIAVASVAYWLRGSLAKAAIEGLREQNKALEDYRQLEEARASEFSRKLADVTAQLATLDGQIKRGEPQQGLLVTTNATAANVGELQVITAELTEALRALKPPNKVEPELRRQEKWRRIFHPSLDDDPLP